MIQSVILPYTAERTTAQDIDLITRCLLKYDPSVRFLPFDSDLIPVALAKPFSPKTITVTLNNNAPSAIFDFIPGPKFFAPQKSKKRLVDDLVAAGIPMPHTEVFDPDRTPEDTAFGPYIAVKTTVPGSARATGIHVLRTDQFTRLCDEIIALYRDDIAAGHRPLVQQFIPTGPRPTSTRVSTFLGAPIVCFQTIAPEDFCPHKLNGLAGGEATSNFHNNRARLLRNDPEMVSLARRISTVYPTASVLSVDMVRCVETQKIYCLEANLGNLCVLSAPICSELRRDLGVEGIHKQFGSYEVIARRIIETLAGV